MQFLRFAKLVSMDRWTNSIVVNEKNKHSAFERSPPLPCWLFFFLLFFLFPFLFVASYGSSEETKDSHFVLCVVDCLWAVLADNSKNQEHFFLMEGEPITAIEEGIDRGKG